MCIYSIETLFSMQSQSYSSLELGRSLSYSLKNVKYPNEALSYHPVLDNPGHSPWPYVLQSVIQILPQPTGGDGGAALLPTLKEHQVHQPLPDFCRLKGRASVTGGFRLTALC